LKNSFSNGAPKPNLGKPEVAEKTGEEVHAKLFEEKAYKTPAHWQQIIAYY